MKSYYDICEFGAQPDGKTMNTAAIQKAIDACHQAGGGRVLCGPGCFLTGSLTLKTNVELHLTAGCRIKGSPPLADYGEFVAPGLFGKWAPEKSCISLLGAVDAENIAITGPGEINGSGVAFYDVNSADSSGKLGKPPTPRPRLVIFYKCRHVRVEDASFVDSPCWTLWLMKCREVNIHRIQIRGDRRMRNNDGIDIDACRDVTVSDCILDTEDDCLVLRAIQQMYDTPAVCENVTVNNCVLGSQCQGVRIGCPGDGVIRNCTFSNLVIHNSRCNGILFEFPRRYLPENGQMLADVHDIMFSNVVIDCAKWPIKIVVEEGIKLPRVSDLSFSNFRIKSGGPCLVQGSPETIIRNVSFSNIEMETTGPDTITCRYCRGIKLTNVELTNRTEGSDNRE
jgi:polygalacturonase